MTDDERRQMMDFILAQQARFWASQQKLEEDLARLEKSQEKAAEKLDIGYLRVDRLERLFKLMVKAGRRARQERREQDQRFAQHLDDMRKSGEEFDRRLVASREEFDRRLVAMREAQEHSDGRLDALIDIVREQRNGKS